MIMFNRGSSMIEVLIYITLMAIMVLGALSWFSRSQRALLKAGASSNMLMALYSATDLLIRDVRMSPKNSDAWFRFDPDALMWRSESNDIGWYVDRKTLYRIEGTFDRSRGSWSHKKRSIALQNIEKVLFRVVQQHKVIDHVDILLVVQAGGMRHTVQECVFARESGI